MRLAAYHKTSNTSRVSNRSRVSNISRVQSKLGGVHLVPTYDTNSCIVLNNYDKTA